MAKYTLNQIRAYHSGRGYRMAYDGKKIDFKNPANKDSFMAGFRKAKASSDKAPKLDRKRKTNKKKS